MAEQLIVLRPLNWTLFDKPTFDGVPTLPIRSGTTLPGQPLSIQFDFPQAPGIHWAGYMTTGRVASLQIPIEPIQIGDLITIQGHVDTTPDAVFEFFPDNTGTMPPCFHIFLEGNAFLSPDPLDRWWFNPALVALAPGPFSLSVVVDPSKWSSTFGAFADQDADTLAHFERALAAPERIGLTFGGGSFFGHGVRMAQGSAVFTMTRYEIGGTI